METMGKGNSCDEDNASIAARSLLTLNTSRTPKSGPYPTAVQIHISPQDKSQRDLVEPANQNLTQNCSPQDNLNMVDVGAIAVRVDRSSGNPHVEILKTGTSDDTDSSAISDVQKIAQKMEIDNLDGEEVFSIVKAVIKKKTDVKLQQYVSIFQDIGVPFECEGGNITVSGSLSAVNTIHDCLKDLYKEEAFKGKDPVDMNDIDDNSVLGVNHMDSDSSISTDKSKSFGSATSSQTDNEINITESFSQAYKCSYCRDGFETAKGLVEHCLEFHSDESAEQKKSSLKSYKCSQCTKIFQSAKFLIQHTEEVHGPNTCTLCGKQFALKRYLNMHMKRHSDGNKKHACEVCDLKFLERCKLRLHMESHKPKSEKNLPHVCTVCNGQFYNKATLEDHMNTHTGNRPFVCKLCNADFAHRIGLKRHMVVHSKDKDYKCPMCPKEFSFKAKLDDHLITHTGEGKYTCQNCDKIFTTKSSLKRHTENCMSKSKEIMDNSDAVFMCGICSLVFDSLEKASIHAASHEI